MADISDYTTCTNCECSLCYIDGCWFETCGTCNAEVCYACLQKEGVIKEDRASRSNLKLNDLNEPHWFVGIKSEKITDEDVFYDDEYFLNCCPYCDQVLNEIDKDELIKWLCEKIGEDLDSLEKEFKGL